jgi:hypothetical protein
MPLPQVHGAKLECRGCTGRGILRDPSPFIWSRGAKEGRPLPLHIVRQPTQRRTY